MACRCIDVNATLYKRHVLPRWIRPSANLYADSDTYVRIFLHNMYTCVVVINPLMLSGLFYHNSLDRSISNRKGVLLILLLPCSKEYLYLMQTVQTLIRRRVLRRLILVYTVCQYPLWDAMHK